MLSCLWEPTEVRYRGGARQRMAQGEGDRAAGTISRSAAGHLLDWCDGTTSAAKLGYHLNNAIADGFRHPMVERLAGATVGSRTAQRGLYRYLQRTLGLDSLLTHIEPSDQVSRTRQRARAATRARHRHTRDRQQRTTTTNAPPNTTRNIHQPQQHEQQHQQ